MNWNFSYSVRLHDGEKMCWAGDGARLCRVTTSNGSTWLGSRLDKVTGNWFLVSDVSSMVESLRRQGGRMNKNVDMVVRDIREEALFWGFDLDNPVPTVVLESVAERTVEPFSTVLRDLGAVSIHEAEYSLRMRTAS